MPKVYCGWFSCEYCKKEGEEDFICGCDEIRYSDDCMTYISHVEVSSEYCKTFWKKIQSRKDKHECKLKCDKGKRYEMLGLVWFTDQDDRWGIDDVWFTEQKTGLWCKGRDITKEILDKVKDKLEVMIPVVNLPEAEEGVDCF